MKNNLTREECIELEKKLFNKWQLAEEKISRPYLDKMLQIARGVR